MRLGLREHKARSNPKVSEHKQHANTRPFSACLGTFRGKRMRRKMYIKWLAWFLAGLMILPSVAPASVPESPGTDIAIEETRETETQETVPETEALPPIEETQTGSEVTAAEEPEVPAGQDAEEALLEILHEDEIHDILTSDEEYYATQENFRLRSARTSAGSFYQQLAAQEAVFYEQLEEGDLLACAKEDTSFVFMQGTDMVVEIAYRDLNTYLSSEEYRTRRASYMSMVARAFDAYLKDNPEEFWMRGFTIGSLSTYNPNRPVDEIQTITIRIFLKFTDSLYYEGVLEDIEAVQSALQTAEDTIRERLNGQTDRYVIAAEIHEYITDLMSYPANWTAGYGYWHTISGPLLEKYNHQGVCEGYAKLFKYFCDQFEVPCMIVIGSSSSGGSVDHMWNYAQMEDGAWYLVDVTWDDVSTPRWTYFMKKKQTSTHVPYGVFSGGISYSAFTYPTLSDTDYTYTPTTVLQGITLNKSTLSLNRGSTGSLTVSYQPSQPSGVSAAWTSSNSSVATVNSSGVVTAVGEGTAVITASAGGFKATCTVTVTLTSRMMIEDFVTRLYKLVLGRTPDAGGLTYWADLLQSKKKTGVEVAYGFFFSDEYINKKVSDSTFTEALYRTLLDRNSDASGKAYWLNYLSTGVTRHYVFAGFANSTEFAGICNKYQITRGSYQSTAIADQNVKVTAFVSRMYTVCLGRGFDRAGLDDWVGRLLRGETTGKGIIYGFFFSTEFKSKNTSNETFVSLAYKTLFDRNPDTAGYNDWLARLRSGQSRETVLNGFIGSAEFTRLCENFGIRKE